MVQLVEGLPRLPLTYLSNGPGCLGQACQSPLVLYNYCCPAVGYGLSFLFLAYIVLRACTFVLFVYAVHLY